MLYKELADIAGHFNRDDLDIDGILQSFCLRRFADMRFLASFLFQIEQDGTLHIRGFFGADPKEIGLSGTSLSIFDDHPAAESIRSDSIVCSDTFSLVESHIRSTLIAWPVQDNSRTLGSLVVITDVKCEKTDESREFIDALAMLLNNAITKRLLPMRSLLGGRNGHRSTEAPLTASHNGSGEESLTERQSVILKLIAEGRTNVDIAEILGYSESLIRQETIRIYAHLNCNGRSEAAKIYRMKFESTNQEHSVPTKSELIS
jgi:DNA-binding CsgD family transcriptional regulator